MAGRKLLVAAPRLPRVAPPSSYITATADDLEPDAQLEDLRLDGVDAADRDLSGATFNACALYRPNLHQADLTGATFAETVIEDLQAPVLSAARSHWWGSTLLRPRVGSGELYDGVLRSVLVEAGKLDLVNLRYAKLQDVRFTGCIIDDLDLTQARLTRVAFEDCRIGHLRLSAATLADVDLRNNEIRAIEGLDGLRGAAIDEDQLRLLAPALAAHLGITVA